jgi:AraC-type transcriptional regulator
LANTALLPHFKDLDGLDMRFLAPPTDPAFRQRTAYYPFGVAARRAFPPSHRAPQKRRVPVASLLQRAGLTPEVIAEPEERLSVRSQITLLDEAAIALQDDCLGFTMARDFEPPGGCPRAISGRGRLCDPRLA